MNPGRLTVLELVPGADELWVLDQHSIRGHLWHKRGAVALPDVARGAKLRPHVTATYAAGKATNVARVLDAFLREDATGDLAIQAKQRLAARLVTYLPGEPDGYHRPDIPGCLLSQFTPGAAYVACLQARDFDALELDLRALPPTSKAQADRRCINIVASEGDELVNFSPYLLWERSCVEAVLESIATQPPAQIVALAGSLPLVDDAPAPRLYAGIIARLREQMLGAVISLDVGGAPLRACLETGPEASPSVVCINMDEYSSVPLELWERYPGIVVIHNKRGCWVLRGEAQTEAELNVRDPDVSVPCDVRVSHTICTGDAAHGGLLLGIVLYGTEPEGLRRAAVLSQACALTVVESEDGIRGLTADKVERNLERF